MTDQIFYTEGAGNTFFLSFNSNHDFEFLRKKAANEGLDPDGYILAPLESDKVVHFNFYNKDKSLVDFCGNALRAVGLCFKDQFGLHEVTLNTAVGSMQVTVLDGAKDDSLNTGFNTGVNTRLNTELSNGLSNELVKAQMPDSKIIEEFVVDNKNVTHVLSGVPHLVFSTHEFSLDLDLKGSLLYFSENIRKMNLGGRESFNLTYYDDQKSGENVFCVTYERGVEGFTQACGSGALSVYKVLQEKKNHLRMPGGDLYINTEKGICFMTGPAKIIKRMKL